MLRFRLVFRLRIDLPLSDIVEAEKRHAPIHGLRLEFKRFGGGGIHFHQSRVLLGHFIRLGQRRVDLIDAGRSLIAGIGDTAAIRGASQASA